MVSEFNCAGGCQKTILIGNTSFPEGTEAVCPDCGPSSEHKDLEFKEEYAGWALTQQPLVPAE